MNTYPPPKKKRGGGERRRIKCAQVSFWAEMILVIPRAKQTRQDVPWINSSQLPPKKGQAGMSCKLVYFLTLRMHTSRSMQPIERKKRKDRRSGTAGSVARRTQRAPCWKCQGCRLRYLFIVSYRSGLTRWRGAPPLIAATVMYERIGKS